MNDTHTRNIDTLGKAIGNAALTMLIRIYPDIRRSTSDQLDAACEAMRAKSRSVVDTLLDDVKAAPAVADMAFQAAALDLANEGMRVLQASHNRKGTRT